MLSNHKLDACFYEIQKKNRERQQDERQCDERQQCNDEAPGSNPTSFAQREPTCYCCGKKGHVAPNCDKRDSIPRSEWHVNRAMQNLQDGADDADDDDDSLIDDDDSVETQ